MSRNIGQKIGHLLPVTTRSCLSQPPRLHPPSVSLAASSRVIGRER
jgi:hypothetical protein